jgi:hypothetical protein
MGFVGALHIYQFVVEVMLSSNWDQKHSLWTVSPLTNGVWCQAPYTVACLYLASSLSSIRTSKHFECTETIISDVSVYI